MIACREVKGDDDLRAFLKRRKIDRKRRKIDAEITALGASME